jgi:fermentation-respiration switch protein FrsA (DUF1100 family)
MQHVPELGCPSLFVAARDDDMVPLAFVEKAHGLAPRSELRVFDGGHFALYVGEHAEQNARAQAEFLGRHLGAAEASGGLLSST